MQRLSAAHLLLSLATLTTPALTVAQNGGTRTGTTNLDTVRVKGERTESRGYRATTLRSGTRTPTPLRDVPQSVAVITRAQIADQAMRSMSDVVRYVPGVTMGQGEGHRDAPTIRGVSSTADFFVNGVRDDAQYLRDVYNLERVEALKGANALAFGRGGGGGVLNRVTKEAQWMRSGDLSLEAGSFSHTRGTFDVGNALSPRAAVRLTGMAEHSGSFRNAIGLDRSGVNPTVAMLLGSTALRLGFEHFQDRRTVDRGIPSFNGVPLAGATRAFFGNPDENRSRAFVRSGSAVVERGEERGVMVRSHLRFTDYDKSYQNTVPGSVSADGSEVTIAAYRNDTRRRNLFNQTDVIASRTTGAVRHVFLVGAEFARQATDNFRETGYFDGTATSVRALIGAPTIGTPVAFRQSATDADNSALAHVVSGYVQHQAELGTHWQTTVGLRWDRFAIDFDDHRSGAARSRTDALVSPRAGLVFKPIEALSAYGSYSISSLPSSGEQFSSLDATTETLAPERFTNREVGLKWDARPSLAVTVALFQLDRTNTRANDPNTPGRIVQTGAQRSSGGELGVTGHVTSRWQLAGGWAVQRATIRRATSSAAAGATIPLVPYQMLSLWNRVRLQQRVGAALGIVHQGRMYAAIDNRVTLPAFTRWDGALYVDLSRQMRMQVNVENLLGVSYFATAHGNNNILPGAPRTVRLSLVASP